MSFPAISPAYSKQVGSLLKSAREERSLEVTEIALKIALSPSQLRLLEQGETAAFYNHHFYLQATRRYAEFLGIELPPSVEKTQQAPPIEPPVKIQAPRDPSPQDASPPRKTWITAAVSVGVSAFVIVIVLLQPERNLTQMPVNEASVTTPAAAPISNPPSAAITAPAAVAPAAVAPAAVAPSAVAPAPAAVTTPAAVTAPPAAPAPIPSPASASAATGSSFVNQNSTWIQIVGKDGNKTNLRPQAGEVVQFDAQSTAAVAFGRPSTAKLIIDGQEVNVERFLVDQAKPARALVILKDL